jgi:pyruvate,orthophosphate dikinase
MQARAVFEAAANVKRQGIAVEPEVMIPLVGHVKEFTLQAALVRALPRTVLRETGTKFRYLVGTMIEVPRGALTAEEIGKHADFFSFGTNDLTQTRSGCRATTPAVSSRRTSPTWRSTRGTRSNRSTRAASARSCGSRSTRGRGANAKLKLGICGEHGGDPASVRFCDAIGLSYVSCSPFRIAIARLAAAQAQLAR